MESRKQNLIIGAGLLFIFGLGVFSKWMYLVKAGPLSLADLYFYQGLAQAFSARDWEHFWHFHFYPVYPILMVFFRQISGQDLIASARWLNIIFDGLSAFPIYLLGKNLYGKRAGVFAALFWSLCWPRVRVYGDPEPVYGFFIFVGMVWMFRNPLRLKDYLIAIGLAGWSGLIKSEAMLFVFFFSLMYLGRSREGLGKKILGLFAAILVFLSVTSPLWIKYYQATGRFNPNPKSRTLIFIHNYKDNYQTSLYGLKEDGYGLYSNAQRIYIEGDKRPIRNSLASFLWETRGIFALAYLNKLEFALQEDLPYLLQKIFPGALILAGVYWLRRKRNYDLDREPWLWFWGIAVLFSLAAFDVWERFFYSFFPVLILVSAKGMEQLMDGAGMFTRRFSRDPKTAGVIRWAVAGVFIFWFILFNFGGISLASPDEKLQERFEAKTRLARELKLRIDLSAKIMCRGFPEPITYFLDQPFWRMVIMPLAKEDELLDYAREAGARYMFFEQEDLKRVPYSERWLYGEVEREGVKRIRHIPRELKDGHYPGSFYELEEGKR